MTAGGGVSPIGYLGLRGFLSWQRPGTRLQGLGWHDRKGRDRESMRNLLRFPQPLTSHLKPGGGSVELIWTKLENFDLLDWATQQSITELQA